MKDHRHYWKKLLRFDKTGGFVICKCGDIRFLNDKESRKFIRLTKQGIKGNQINVEPKQI